METVNDGRVSQIFLSCVEECFEPIMLTDKFGLLTYVNPAWVSTYGFSKAEAVGRTARILRSTHHSDDFYIQLWNEIREPGKGFWRGEVINRAKDGHHVPVLLTITPYREASGEITGYMGIAVDLTYQKKMEAKIVHQDWLASLGLLASGLAHEIGNPLGVIRGRAEIVMKHIQGNAIAEKGLGVIVGQIDRISILIQSLLRVSRVPEHLVLKEVDLRSVIAEVLSLMQESCKLSRIDLRSDCGDQYVCGEPVHMQQLFLNLVLNSVHAIEEKRAKGMGDMMTNDSILISSQSIAGRCIVKVDDTGCGVSPEILPKIFQPFFTTKPAGKGTGLGLAIVMKLVEEMDGKVSADSAGVGLGTQFKLEFKIPVQDFKPANLTNPH